MSAQTHDPTSSRAPTGVLDELRSFWRWCRENPVQVALLICIVFVLYSFYFLYQPLLGGQKSFGVWTDEAFGKDNDLEHGRLILPGALLVAWMHRRQFARAEKAPSIMGLAWLLGGILLFLIAVRTLQARIALVALPLLIIGCVHFVWGWRTARHAVFPCLLLLFLVPIGFILSRTEPLQRFVAAIVDVLSNLVGIGLHRDGVKLIALDQSFQCEVAGGCSGVRSIMAMTMLSLLYVHFNERVLWKKVTIFAMTLPFTIVGNIFRVFSIVLVTKWFGQNVGTGPWHDISGFIIGIPISVFAMIKFSDLLNRDWSGLKEKLLARDIPEPLEPDGEQEVEKLAGPEAQPKPEAPRNKISYDY
jgi:exosortase